MRVAMSCPSSYRHTQAAVNEH
jgi:Transposase DDE domain